MAYNKYIDWNVYNDIRVAKDHARANDKGSKRRQALLEGIEATIGDDVDTRIDLMRKKMVESRKNIFMETHPIPGVAGVNPNSMFRPSECENENLDPMLPSPAQDNPNGGQAQEAPTLPERIDRDTCPKVALTLTWYSNDEFCKR